MKDYVVIAGFALGFLLVEFRDKHNISVLQQDVIKADKRAFYIEMKVLYPTVNMGSDNIAVNVVSNIVPAHSIWIETPSYYTVTNKDKTTTLWCNISDFPTNIPDYIAYTTNYTEQ